MANEGTILTAADLAGNGAQGNDPDVHGKFGIFGGRFVPEALIPALDEVASVYEKAKNDQEFIREFDHLLRTYAGRPTTLTDVPRFSEQAGGARIVLKREDLTHTGAHKINNVLGQALLTKRLGKKRVIAETGAGQHGVATATAAALLGLECVIYMGAVDCERQALNVARMKLLGAQVVPVTNVDTTHYLFGTIAGPHPFPEMVRDFARIIGVEARRQIQELTGRLPDAVCAAVGGGSNAIGIFHAFLGDQDVRLHGYEAAGHGLDSGEHALTLTAGTVGVLHGSRTYVLQDDEGQTIESHSISAGLDYPGVGPEHAWLKDIGRATYHGVTDDQAMQAFSLLARTEGIIPAIESSHALAGALELGRELGPEATILVNLSGRGDKDMGTAMKYFNL